MAVRVRVTGKLTRDFTIPILWSVSNLKGSIKAWCGIEADRQVLYEGEQERSDDFSFRNHPEVIGRSDMELENVVIEFSLRVNPLAGDPKFDVFLNCNPGVRDWVWSVRMRETQKVDSLRVKVALARDNPLFRTILRHFDDVHYSRIGLSHLGQDMEDDRVLSDYYVCPGSQIQVHIIPK